MATTQALFRSKKFGQVCAQLVVRFAETVKLIHGDQAIVEMLHTCLIDCEPEGRMGTAELASCHRFEEKNQGT